MLVPDLAAPEGERVKLLDFGIAKLDTDRDMDANTRKGEILGTATYMAPEQFQSDAPLDGQCDVYALAVVMYRLVCGTVPFVSTSGEFGLAAMHMFQQHQSLREVAPQTPPWLSDLVDTMLSKDPKKRPTMADIGEELLQHLSFRPPPKRMSRDDNWANGPALEIIAEHEDSSLFAPTTGPEPAPQISPILAPASKQSPLARLRAEWQQRRPRVLIALGVLVVLLGLVVWLLARPSRSRLPVTPISNQGAAQDANKPATSADVKSGTGPTGSVDPAGQIADPDLEKKGPPGAHPEVPGLLKNDAKPPRPRKRFKIIN